MDLLFIIFTLPLLIKAQSYDKPIISVDNSTDPLTISCGIPESDTTDVTCNLYTEDGPLKHTRQKTLSGKKICRFFINHLEIFTHKQTVSSRQLSCDYSIKTDLRSPRSDVYTIRGFPQAMLRVSPSVITDTDTVQMNCLNRKNQKINTCFFTVDGMESNMKESRSCHLSLTGYDIIVWSGGQRSSVIITCYYTVFKSNLPMSSPQSDPVKVTVKGKGFPQAVLRVSPSEITDTDTVQMNCMNRENLKMDTCFFTVDGMESNMKESRSCHLSLTGYDIIVWSGGQRSSVIITCYYTVFKSNLPMSSPQSDPVKVTVKGKGFPQPMLRVSPSVITDTDTVQMNCLNKKNQKINTCFFTVDGMESNMKESRSCHLSLTGYDIIVWSGGQRSSVNITCYYNVFKSNVPMSSPQSDPVKVTVKGKVSTSTITAKTTTTTHMTTPQTTTTTRMTTPQTTTTTRMTTPQTTTTTRMTTPQTTTTTHMTSFPAASVVSTTVTKTNKTSDMWITLLSAAGCSVFVLTGLMCYCMGRYICKEKTKRQRTAGDTRATGHAEIYSMITSVPDTSQPTGLKRAQSHQDSKPGPSETYSLIISTSKPSDGLVNAQHKKERTEENENVHQVYCTITDKPMNTVAADPFYSLARY